MRRAEVAAHAGDSKPLSANGHVGAASVGVLNGAERTALELPVTQRISPAFIAGAIAAGGRGIAGIILGIDPLVRQQKRVRGAVRAGHDAETDAAETGVIAGKIEPAEDALPIG